MERMYTPKQAAEELQVSLVTLMGWLREGRLKGYKIGDGRLWRIKESDLEAFLQPRGR